MLAMDHAKLMNNRLLVKSTTQKLRVSTSRLLYMPNAKIISENPFGTEEKLGGIGYNIRKSLEFIRVIEACGLMNLGFNGPGFTWSNQRGINFRNWKRLDRAMVNGRGLQDIPHTSITHLPSVGSDHCPLLMEMNALPDNYSKYFIFLNCWADQPSFVETITYCWSRPIEGYPMWTFHQKMKTLASNLSVWSKMQFGDIYAKVKDFEERVWVAEENLIHNNTEEHIAELHVMNADYIRFMKLEDSILKQKSQLQWFKEGDGEEGGGCLFTKSSKTIMSGYMVMNTLNRLPVNSFRTSSKERKNLLMKSPMNCIPRIVNQEHNVWIKELPTMDELKEVVYSMNPNSAVGPDGMNGCFFQNC
ncbi:hypothetical protein KY290_036517 [Solanum tuberosum]|uniref:Non-LTR retroelement reverse transcriptase n=1 Tax=Solanum tuberosum TaxID=4113 RepID=A0ABQ7TSX5_SOLTU|nr:hypothetical protein KY290_036517 [Solanum tuberosum]